MPAQPNLRYALGSTVAPGDRICSARKCGAGDGVYVRGGNIYASSVGKLNLVASGDTYAVTVEKIGNRLCADQRPRCSSTFPDCIIRLLSIAFAVAVASR